MQWRLIVTLGLMVLVVIFSLANAAPASFNYLFGQEEISLALIIILSALTGAIAGVAASLSAQLRLRRELQAKDRELRQMVKEKGTLEGEVEARDRLRRDERRAT